MNALKMVGITGIALLALGGCAHVEIPKEVRVPVPVPCVDQQDVPKPPIVHTPEQLLAMDDYRRTLQLWSDYLQLLVITPKYQAIADGCSKIGPIKLDAVK